MTKVWYRLCSSRISLREWWWWHKSPLTFLVWVLARLRVPILIGSDDPNVETLAPFEVDEAQLPQNVRDRFTPLIEQLKELGFHSPIYHVIAIPFRKTTISWATFCHSSGQACARVHLGIWKETRPVRIRLFPVFITGFDDGGFLVSWGGKPDMLPPRSCQVRFHDGAGVRELWDEHQKELEKRPDRFVIRVTGQTLVRGLVESHHAHLRDHHLERGVFVPIPEDELESIRSSLPTLARPENGDEADAEQTRSEDDKVLAEMHRIRTRKTGWIGAAIALALTLVVFILVKDAQWSLKDLFYMIPILFFHEMGHLVAMRFFGYRNTRMLFIPFFGAAVTGQHFNVPGWKKAIVFLMGPVPGILVGGALGVAGLTFQQSSLIEVGLLALILNGFNLLPFLPLDGGQVLQATLFCRSPYLEVGFRGVAILGILGLGLLLQTFYLWLVCLPMLLSLAAVYRTAKISDKLRSSGLALPGDGDDAIPDSMAREILSEVRAGYPGLSQPRALALVTINVFEKMNARPPGGLATAAIWAVHASSFILAIILTFVLAIGQRGDFGKFLESGAERPKTPYERGSTITKPAILNENQQAEARNTIVANFPSRDAAETAFADISGRIPKSARLTLFGQTLLLSLPADAVVERNIWFSEVQRLTDEVGLDQNERPLNSSLFGLAPSRDTALQIEEELGGYLAISTGLPLIPPWSKDYERSPETAKWSKARRTYHRLTHWTPDEMDTNGAAESMTELLEAMKRGDNETRDKLLKEIQARTEERWKNKFELIRAEGPEHVDIDVINAYEKWWLHRNERPNPNDQDDDDVSGFRAMLKSISKRVGVLDEPKGVPSAKQRLVWGYISHSGLNVSVQLAPRQIDTDLPALAEWLYAQGYIDVTYQCELAKDDDLEDN
ncbi:MAG: site-2 protease family protein [Gemmataceae bacterium]